MAGALGKWKLGGVIAVLTAGSPAAHADVVTARTSIWEAPGDPVQRLVADLDGDGRSEILVRVEATRWDRISYDRVEDGVQITEVLPVLIESRTLHVLAENEDGWAEAADPLELDDTVFALEPGPSFAPAIALGAGGVTAIGWDGPGAPLKRTPLIDASWPIDRVRDFAGLASWSSDLDGDGERDLLLPGLDGYRVYLAREDRFDELPAAGVPHPTPAERTSGNWARIPIPRMADLDGDGHVDLAVQGSVDGGTGGLIVIRGLGGGRFDAPAFTRYACLDPPEREGDWSFGDLTDLDGDGRHELVLRVEHRPEKDGLRASMKAAKNPDYTLAIHAMNGDGTYAETPTRTLEFVGYPTEGNWLDPAAGLFRDLDGDGRQDLVTLTLDFSILQAVRVVATKRFSIGVDFEVRRQDEEGGFPLVPGVELSDKLKLDLRDSRFRRAAQFSGDLDGDGRVDFVRVGLGKTVQVHRGRAGARYAAEPDRSIELGRAVTAVERVDMVDLDGDGRDELWTVESLDTDDEAATPKHVVAIHRIEERP